MLPSVPNRYGNCIDSPPFTTYTNDLLSIVKGCSCRSSPAVRAGPNSGTLWDLGSNMQPIFSWRTVHFTVVFEEKWPDSVINICFNTGGKELSVSLSQQYPV